MESNKKNISNKKVNTGKKNNAGKDNCEFAKLGLKDEVLRAVCSRFETPTEIQKKAIPVIIEGKDVIGGSKTGSGKTLAFSAGVIQKVKNIKKVQALILTPTRELANQVSEAFKSFSKFKKINVTTVYGGVSINPQIERLKKTDVVIGTPGRILDHMSRGTLKLNNVETLILDEADMMLDMGFLPDVTKIIKETPNERQSLLFTATISKDVDQLSRRFLKNPTKVSAETYVDPTNLKQVYFDVPNNRKFSLLVHLIKEEEDNLVMVFCNTRHNSDFVAENLKLNGIKANVIHGGLSQKRRDTVLRNFHEKKLQVLVCTDVAARGLDIKGVSHVYNYDTNSDPKQYVHRIGRTARAGNSGKAVTLLSKRDYEHFDKVIHRNKMTIDRNELPMFERAKVRLKENNRKRNSKFYKKNFKRNSKNSSQKRKSYSKVRVY